MNMLEHIPSPHQCRQRQRAHIKLRHHLHCVLAQWCLALSAHANNPQIVRFMTSESLKVLPEAVAENLITANLCSRSDTEAEFSTLAYGGANGSKPVPSVH